MALLRGRRQVHAGEMELVDAHRQQAMLVRRQRVALALLDVDIGLVQRNVLADLGAVLGNEAQRLVVGVAHLLGVHDAGELRDRGEHARQAVVQHLDRHDQVREGRARLREQAIDRLPRTRELRLDRGQHVAGFDAGEVRQPAEVQQRVRREVRGVRRTGGRRGRFDDGVTQ